MKFCPILQVSNSIHSGKVLKKERHLVYLVKRRPTNSFFFFLKKKSWKRGISTKRKSCWKKFSKIRRRACCCYFGNSHLKLFSNENGKFFFMTFRLFFWWNHVENSLLNHKEEGRWWRFVFCLMSMFIEMSP